MAARSELPPRNGLVAQMVKGAVGPLSSALPLFALPLVGATFLSSGQFAMWSILASISSMALSLDFGGPSYLASRLDPRNRTKPFVHATTMTCLGTAAMAVLSICAWVPFSRTSAGGAFDFLAGVGAITVISCGSALRSIVQLQAQMALFDGRFALRNVILLGHSITALVVAVAVLVSERTAWALPIGWLAAGGTGALIGSLVFRRPANSLNADWAVETCSVASGGTYAWARTVATVFRGFLMQADRWIVGAIGGPAVLAAYEVAWRIAAMPRFLAENLTWVVGLDAARVRASSPQEISARVSYCIRFTLTILITFSTAAALFYALLPNITGVEIAWPFFFLLLVGHGALATGAPVSFVGNGIGIPTIDLPYLTLSVVMSTASAALAFITNDVYLFIGGTVAAILIGNLWFVRYGLKAIRSATSRPVSSLG